MTKLERTLGIRIWPITWVVVALCLGICLVELGIIVGVLGGLF